MRLVVLFISIFCFSLNYTSIEAQKVHTRKLADSRFTEYYQVSAADNAILDGKYELYYKSHLIEKGRFKNGKRAGVWNFYNLDNFFEFQYDFSRDTLLMMTGVEYYKRRNYTPPIFLGSPLIPYIHILDALGYPVEAYEKNVEGKVVLTLIISTSGDIVDSFISVSLDESTDNAVLETVQGFPDTWKWLPAKKDGVKIESAYNITVFFDLN